MDDRCWEKMNQTEQSHDEMRSLQIFNKYKPTIVVKVVYK